MNYSATPRVAVYAGSLENAKSTAVLRLERRLPASYYGHERIAETKRAFDGHLAERARDKIVSCLSLKRIR